MGSKSIKRLHEGEYCLECGAPATATHHLIFGKNRANSEAYGLTVRLCHNCHRKLHDTDERMALKYRKLGQIAFEYRYDHELYMKVFGRSYI